MNENEEKKIKQEKISKNVNTSVYIKEKRNGAPVFLIVLVTALIASIISSGVMYLILTKDLLGGILWIKIF